jgi:hypothetical protein
VQPHGDAADQPERAERAGEQLAEVVAGDVLDHLAAGARDRAVGQDDRDADHEVAHAAVAVAQRPRVVGGDDAADRRRVAGAERRVEREHLPLGRERRLCLQQRHAGLEDRREVADVVLEDARQRARVEVDDRFPRAFVRPAR